MQRSNFAGETAFDVANSGSSPRDATGNTRTRHVIIYFTEGLWQLWRERVDTSNTTPYGGMRYIELPRWHATGHLALGRSCLGLSVCTSCRCELEHDGGAWSDSGSVQERYEYDPYGQLSVFGADSRPAPPAATLALHHTSREWTPTAGLFTTP